MSVGLVRARRHLFVRQAAFGSPLPAVHAWPFTGVPSQDEQWTDPGGDFGSIYPVAAPYRGAGEYTQGVTADSLDYNMLALLLSGHWGGAVAATGGPPDWTRAYVSNADGSDADDVFSREFGDDADGSDSDEPNDWEQNGDGLITSLTIDSPEQGSGVLTASADWMFSSYFYEGSTDNPPATAIPSIPDYPDTNPPYVYLKDAKVYIDNDASDIGGNQISDTVYKFTLRGTREIDKKWRVNGTGSFAPQELKTASRAIELDLIMAKTPDAVGVGSEKDAWSSNTSINRYVSVVFESQYEVTPGVPFSWSFSLPLRYYTMVHGEIGGNTTVVLTGHAFVDPDFGVFQSDLVNALADADL
jgi:hypothetical protein